MIVDLFLVYSFIRRLATPFKDWEAFKLGIIDENGNILKKRKDLKYESERKAFGVFDVMVLNLKKILASAPGGSSKIASYAAALYLIREWNCFSDSTLLSENTSDEEISESLDSFYDRYVNYIIEMNDVNQKSELDVMFERKIFETPTVSAGSGNIAGIGVGSTGEPGLTLSQMRRYKNRNKSGKKLRDVLNIKEDGVSTVSPGVLTRQHGKLRRNNKHARPGTIPSTIPSERLT